MFGVGIFEILVILIVAVIFLGPDKLPQAVVDLTKFIRAVKKTINDAKDTFDKELQINELKKEALEYKKLFTDDMNALKNEVDSLKKEVEFKELNNLALNNPTNQPLPIHPQKSAESLSLESLNFQSEQLDAQIAERNAQNEEISTPLTTSTQATQDSSTSKEYNNV